MSDSPFRDDSQALRSVIEELQRENAAMREEIESLRARLPENAEAFTRRLEEENGELRRRVAVLEALQETQTTQRRPRWMETVQTQEAIASDVGALVARIWRRLTGG